MTAIRSQSGAIYPKKVREERKIIMVVDGKIIEEITSKAVKNAIAEMEQVKPKESLSLHQRKLTKTVQQIFISRSMLLKYRMNGKILLTKLLRQESLHMKKLRDMDGLGAMPEQIFCHAYVWLLIQTGKFLQVLRSTIRIRKKIICLERYILPMLQEIL